MQTAGILILDDVENILDSLKGLFELEDFDVTTASCPNEALKHLEDKTFAVIISDQQMPEMRGTEFLRKAREIAPDTVRILLTGYMDMDAAIEAINEGAVYKYVTKPWNDQELIMLVSEAMARYMQREEEKQLQNFAAETYEKLGAVLGGAKAPAPESSEVVPPVKTDLSEREIEILRHAAQGLSNKEIGEAVHVSQLTVKNHMANIYKKLGVANRTQAVMLAQKHGVIPN